jgi:hypothetical protein
MAARQMPWKSWMRITILLINALYLSPSFPAIAPLYQQSAPQSGEASASEPFKFGERLVYRVEWDPPWYFFFLPKMEAGEIELILSEETEYNGKKALKILFNVRSSGSLAKLAGLKVEDEFAFFEEPATFCSFGASKKVREGKRKRQIDIEYLRESGQLRFRDLDESVNPPKLHKDEIKDNMPACVQDPFSALYYFRMMKLQPGYVHKAVLGHDDRIKEVTCRVEKQENVNTPAGKFQAWKVDVVSLMGGLFKDGGQFRIWFSADERKMPIQFNLKVKLGSVIGKLGKMP